MSDETANLFADVVLNIAYVFFIIAVAAAIILPLIHIAKNPKAFVSSAIGIAIVGVIFLIGYSMATNEVNPQYVIDHGLTAGISKMSGAILNTTYIMMFVAFAGIIISNIRNAFK